jgi:ATP-dependent DNA helicase Rep
MSFELNREQREAARECERPVLVLAGAGSGKTRLITAKIVHLVEQRQLPPERILALTFTRKAAREMAERLRAALGERAQAVRVGTFHAFGLSLLSERPEAFGLRPGFSLLDAEDARRLLGELGNAQGAALAALCLAVTRQRQQGLPAGATALAADGDEGEAARLRRRYEERLQALNAIDLDDLILRPLRACQSDAALRRQLQERFAHVLVDEWQDTNLAQYRLFRELVGDGKPFTVVGDDDQSIYAWRGAHPENLRLLCEDFPTLRVIKLERNYRSTAAILRVANALIAHNRHLFEKRLHSVVTGGEAPLLWACRTPEEEAERIGLDVLRQIELERRRPGDFAVLYRSHHQARVIEEVFRVHRIPYRMSGGMSFFEHREIRDLIAYLRLVCNPRDDVAFLRAVAIPRRAVGEGTLERLAALADGEGLLAGARRLLAERGAARLRGLEAFVAAVEGWRSASASAPLADLARTILRESGLEAALTADREPERSARRRQRLEQFLAFLERRGLEGASGLQEIALLAREEGEETGDAVLLSTIHAAKGLEFPVVYVVGLEEGLLPHDHALAEGQVEEERRLLYVAITRAQQRLVLTRAETRRAAGGWIASAPSRFLAELPAEALGEAKSDPEAARAEVAWHRERIRALLSAAASS